MRLKTGPQERPKQHLLNIRHATRAKYSNEDKIGVVLSGLRGEYSIAVLYRREGIAEILYYTWSKECLEAAKKQMAGARQTLEGRLIETPVSLRRPNSSLPNAAAAQSLGVISAYYLYKGIAYGK